MKERLVSEQRTQDARQPPTAGSDEFATVLDWPPTGVTSPSRLWQQATEYRPTSPVERASSRVHYRLSSEEPVAARVGDSPMPRRRRQPETIVPR